MTGRAVDEDQVERDFAAIGEVRRIAWQRAPEDVMALVDRLRVVLLTEKMPRRRRRLYRALIDYFEEVLEERFETEAGSDPRTARQSALDYVRDLLRGDEDGTGRNGS